ncbi:NhaP-type Na+/H+ or K+/H+ antiporter [Microbacterium resistens]|uniref:NhaP-type Na+/H+ or K+/H+ antiporter n=1 Tax=Microbacterium resistens TaxID=156977 RepID=A0ABU1SGX4_9MICO|nr:cation:proton antiporter [Microbacterium resistens]MDR6868874.1 NhaP-type Na+/H+ or K+/H+ antiporter [Microbacterium resistens]
MPHVVLIGLFAVLLWSLVSRRFQRWGVAGPVGLLVLGAVAVIPDPADFLNTIDARTTEPIVEIILALLLFVDATEVRGSLFGNAGRVILRLILIALPLSLLLTVIAGVYLADFTTIFVLIVMACVVMPTDFAPAAQILRARNLPSRMRQILNVESGYNDGLVSPLFTVAVAVSIEMVPHAAREGDAVGDPVIEDLFRAFDRALPAITQAVPATVYAIAIGVVLGMLAGWSARVARARGLAGADGIRIAMLAVPLIAYALATLPVVSANGFVAAFVAGIAYRLARLGGKGASEERVIPHEELLLAEEVSSFTAQFVWFVLGGVATAALVNGTVTWPLVLFGLLALTVLRIVPVYLSLMGSGIAPKDRLAIGVIGPRGTASIVFGLLAYNQLPEDDGNVVITLMLVTVVGSVLLHGLVVPLLLPRVYPGDGSSGDEHGPGPGGAPPASVPAAPAAPDQRSSAAGSA